MNTSTVRQIVAAVALITTIAVPATIAAGGVQAAQHTIENSAMAVEFCVPLPVGFSVCVRFAGTTADAR